MLGEGLSGQAPAAISASAVFYEVEEDYFQISRIRPWLCLSGKHPEQMKDPLDENGVTHILQVGTGLRPSHPEDYAYLTIGVRDDANADIVRCFPAAFKFIDAAREQEGSTVLVHCHAGVSRSASVVIGYLMYKEGLTWQEALDQVMAARPVVMPNQGFRSQLLHFQHLDCNVHEWRGWESHVSDAKVAAQAVGISSFDPLVAFSSAADYMPRHHTPAHISALLARAHEVPGLCGVC